MSQDGRYFLDSQAEASSQGTQSSEGSNKWDLNDSFINDSHVSSSQYSTTESEYSGWSSGTSNPSSQESSSTVEKTENQWLSQPCPNGSQSSSNNGSNFSSSQP